MTAVWESYCLIIIPYRHAKLFLRYLFKAPLRRRCTEEVVQLQEEMVKKEMRYVTEHRDQISAALLASCEYKRK